MKTLLERYIEYSDRYIDACHGEEESVVFSIGPVEVFGDGISRDRILESSALIIAFDHDFDKGLVDHIHLFFALAIGEVHLFSTD